MREPVASGRMRVRSRDTSLAPAGAREERNKETQMRLRDLQVVLDNTPRSQVLLGIAIELARANGAHLTGLCPSNSCCRPISASSSAAIRR